MTRIPHFLRNRLTDAGKVVSLMPQMPFTPRNIPGTHFCYRLSQPQGHSAAGNIRSIEKSDDLTGNRTRDLPACSIVPHSTTLSHAPVLSSAVLIIHNYSHSLIVTLLLHNITNSDHPSLKTVLNAIFYCIRCLITCTSMKYLTST
jgi:hypothetical protein